MSELPQIAEYFWDEPLSNHAPKENNAHDIVLLPPKGMDLSDAWTAGIAPRPIDPEIPVHRRINGNRNKQRKGAYN